ncbi:hypothetical protein DFH28DRAFT_837176, partial [Melampsora americana]
WQALQVSHEDSNIENCSYWLGRLMFNKPTDDDIDTHIDSELDILLITKEKPLDADEIYVTALLGPFPSDW